MIVAPLSCRRRRSPHAQSPSLFRLQTPLPGQGILLVEQADVQVGLWVTCDSLAGEQD